MREFSDEDRKKKANRIRLPENPGNLSKEVLAALETSVKSAIKDGYVSCPVGWRIAADAGITRLDVGAMIDKLGIRVTDCTLGCFEVSKTPFSGEITEPFSAHASERVEELQKDGILTCAHLFELARQLGAKPRSLAEAANVRGYKIQQCQLGCF